MRQFISTQGEDKHQHQDKGDFGLSRRVWCHQLDQCEDRTNGGSPASHHGEGKRQRPKEDPIIK